MPKCTQLDLEQLQRIAKSKFKSQIIRNCSNKTIKFVCEYFLNVIRGNVPLTKVQKNKLCPHKKNLRKLADKKVPLYKKRRILVQRGEGFLTFLLPAALSVLSSVIHGTR